MAVSLALKASSSKAIYVSKTCVISMNSIVTRARLVLLDTSWSMETAFHMLISVFMVMSTKDVLPVRQDIRPLMDYAENYLITVLL